MTSDPQADLEAFLASVIRLKNALDAALGEAPTAQLFRGDDGGR